MLNSNQNSSIEFVPAAAIPERTPARAFIHALRGQPGRWAKVPDSITTAYLRQIKTFGSFFDVHIELRMKPERFARVLTHAHVHAARRAGTL